MPDSPLVAAIVQTGAPVLRGRAVEVPAHEIVTPPFRELVAMMIATMRAAPGVGLAAPQIGLPLRVIVVEDPADRLAALPAEDLKERERVPFPTRALFNPVVTPIGDERATFFEGCLSVDGFVALVERYRDVEVTALDEDAAPVSLTLRGWPARILQHEVDHLNGTLYVDRMLTRTFATVANAKEHFGGKSVARIRDLLG
jgi:peptide deformylase